MGDSKETNYEETSAGICRRCGIRGDGDHAVPGDRRCSGCGCVDVLREMIAKLEFKLERATNPPVRPTQAGRRGGLRNRCDTRYVVLDGESIPLTTAARALGVSASTLHLRLLNRTHNPHYQNVDIRACGADVAKH